MKFVKSVSLILLLTVIGINPTFSKEFKTGSASPIISAEFLSGMSISNIGDVSVNEFISLSPTSIKERTGKRLKIKDRIALRLTQRALKKQLEKGEEVNFEEANYNFSIGGFLLGFFLGLLGVLIALVAFPKDVFRSSLVGLLCFILALLLGIFLL